MLKLWWNDLLIISLVLVLVVGSRCGCVSEYVYVVLAAQMMRNQPLLYQRKLAFVEIDLVTCITIRRLLRPGEAALLKLWWNSLLIFSLVLVLVVGTRCGYVCEYVGVLRLQPQW